MLRRRGRTVELDRAAILATPPLDATFKKTNPVKYQTNQIFHLTDVTAALERVVLSCSSDQRHTSQRQRRSH